MGIFRRRRHVALSASIQSRHLYKGVATQTVLSLTAPHNPMTQYCSAPFRKNSSGHALEYFDDHRAWHIS